MSVVKYTQALYEHIYQFTIHRTNYPNIYDFILTFHRIQTNKTSDFNVSRGLRSVEIPSALENK